MRLCIFNLIISKTLIILQPAVSGLTAGRPKYGRSFQHCLGSMHQRLLVGDPEDQGKHPQPCVHAQGRHQARITVRQPQPQPWPPFRSQPPLCSRKRQSQRYEVSTPTALTMAFSFISSILPWMLSKLLLASPACPGSSPWNVSWNIQVPMSLPSACALTAWEFPCASCTALEQCILRYCPLI